MLKQPYIETNLLLFHTIVSHFLVNDTDRSDVWEENCKVWNRGEIGPEHASTFWMVAKAQML